MNDTASFSRQLGVGAVVGDEVWDTQGRVRIRIGPLLRIRRYGLPAYRYGVSHARSRNFTLEASSILKCS